MCCQGKGHRGDAMTASGCMLKGMSATDYGTKLWGIHLKDGTKMWLYADRVEFAPDGSACFERSDSQACFAIAAGEWKVVFPSSLPDRGMNAVESVGT